MQPKTCLRIALLLTLASAACNTARHPYLHKTPQPPAAEWGYEGKEGPEHWGQLSPKYHLASDGHAQSPIDIRGAAAADLPALDLDYRPVPIRLIYNGHSVQENEKGNSHLTVDGKRYKLEQFHFHSPSEHTVDGRSFAMELHFVHEGTDGEIAVLSVLIDDGQHNPAYDVMWSHLPNSGNRKENTDDLIPVDKLLPASRDYYAYQGSFTTPPCTEGVRWLVLRQPVQLSAKQIATFRKVIYHNNRPVQPLFGRKISISR